MDPETQKLLRLNLETNQIVEELLQLFQRKEKNLALLQQHTMENICTWSENIKQSNKVLHNYKTTLRDRCHRIQDQLNQPQNNLVKD